MKREELEKKKRRVEKNIVYYSRVYNSNAKVVLDLKKRLEEIESALKKMK